MSTESQSSLGSSADVQSQSLTLAEASNLLWLEWEYRHTIFWQSLYRWGGSVIAIFIFPFLRPEVIKTLGKFVSVFPLIAGALAMLAFWHLGAEYSRLLFVDKRYRQALGDFAPEREKIRFPYGSSIGWTIARVFLALAVLLVVIGILIINDPRLYICLAQADC